MKKILIIGALLVYSFGVFMAWGLGGKLSDALLWPLWRIKGQFASPSGAIRIAPGLTTADGLPPGSMNLSGE